MANPLKQSLTDNNLANNNFVNSGFSSYIASTQSFASATRGIVVSKMLRESNTFICDEHKCHNSFDSKNFNLIHDLITLSFVHEEQCKKYLF